MKLTIISLLRSGIEPEIVFSADLELRHPGGAVFSENQQMGTAYVNLAFNNKVIDFLENSTREKKPVELIIKDLKIDKQLICDPRIEAVKTLTRCEFGILKHLSSGLTYEQIAKLLFKNIETIKSHADKVYLKLNVHKCQKAAEVYYRFISRYPKYLFPGE